MLSLAQHFTKTHKKSTKELCLVLYYDNVPPTCACGCGKEVKYLDLGRKFSKFVVGHCARVHNNWGHNPELLRKSQETRRNNWKQGKYHTWSEGKTKETDEKVRLAGIKTGEAIRANTQELTERSNRMRKNRLDGTVPTLRKEKHSQWKGGRSCLLAVCHANTRFFREWKYPKLLASKFSCEKCGASRDKEPRPNLQVHHDKIQMATIVRMVAEEKGWNDYYALAPATDETTINLKSEISEAVVDYHANHNVSGVVLCEACHKSQHPKHNITRHKKKQS